jgi:GH35 family endo-1,4-beta-xylanase
LIVAKNELKPQYLWLGALLNSTEIIISDKKKSLLSDYIHAVVNRYRGKIP